MNENAYLEAVAGAWITAKATNLFGNSEARESAWNDFASQAERFCKRFGYSQEQFGVKLVESAEILYKNQLKTEIFGYGQEVAA
jgi:hypothetical protein